MPIADHVLDELKKEYGRIAKVPLPNGDELLFRPLRFGEYIKVYEKTEQITVDGKVTYEFDSETPPYIVRNTLVYPANYDVTPLLENPGRLMSISNAVMKITLFEDDQRLASRYVDRYKYMGTILGNMIMTLTMTYGIDGFLKCRNMSAEEVLDLLIISEFMTKNFGQLATSLGKPELLPRNRRGQVNLRALFGDPNAPSPEELYGEPNNRQQQQQDEPDYKHPGSRRLDEINARQTRRPSTRAETFQEKILDAAEQSKALLAATIARDKAVFGDKMVNEKKKVFLGNIDDLKPGLAAELNRAQRKALK